MPENEPVGKTHFHMNGLTRRLVLTKRQKGKVKSAYEPSGQLGRSLSRFLWHEATKSISTPPLDATPSIKFADTYLYTWMERGTVRVNCLAQEHNTMSPPGLEPRPLDPELSALTIRPLRLASR